jgi:hypothetical protein
MAAKTLAIAVLTPLLLSSFLLSQSLTEIAKKERERRASLKGKKVTVVTNADLAKLKKKPALEIPAAPAAPTLEERAAAVPPPADSPETAEPAPQATPPPSPPPAGDRKPATLQELQERWDKAKEYVELLTLKMGALWQEFNGLRDAKSKEAVQQAIGETFAKLQTAQEEEVRARQEFEKFVGETKKESTTTIWFK